MVNSLATKEVVLGQGIDPRVIELVHLGIDTDRFAPTEEPVRPTGGPLKVGFVGRLQQAKGIDFLWRLMEKIGPDDGVQFELKGAIHPATRGDTLKRLKRHAAVAQYRPPTSPTEMPEFYRSLDALLLPSRYESFGLTYVEAMATGLVVFAGRSGGGSEVVDDGVNGFIVDPDGPVTPVLSRLRQMVDDRRAFAQLRRQAREDVVRRYSVEQFASKKLKQYWRVVEGDASCPDGSQQVGR